MDLQLLIIRRLPGNYYQAADGKGDIIKVYEPKVNTPCLTGLTLLSDHNGGSHQQIMLLLQATLADIGIISIIRQWQGQPCLFVRCEDEYAAFCRLKNQGVAIAESFSPFWL